MTSTRRSQLDRSSHGVPGDSGRSAPAAPHAQLPVRASGEAGPLAEAAVSLASLVAGDRARVLDVDASTPVGRRLLDLGFVPGTEVRVVRRSPLGDPIAFYLRGCQLCLRRSEAARIRVAALRPLRGG